MKNKKGFTLIELLAVIVILALLVAVAIPAVTKYLNTSRKGVFDDNASAAISAVRNQTIIDGTGAAQKNLADINKLLEKKLNNSPWGKAYTDASYVKVTEADGGYSYSIYLTDGEHCIGTSQQPKPEAEVTDSAVSTTGCN